MSPFAIFALILMAGVFAFALSNPATVTLRFLAWQFETTVALAVIGAAVAGGLLVFISSIAGQRHLRARVRDLQARLRDVEARAGGAADRSPDGR